jgi:hypothetical protein
LAAVNAILSKYGRDTRIKDTTGWSTKSFRAFIQPLRYKNKMYLEGTPTEIGVIDSGYYLYIGPPEHSFEHLPSGYYIESAGKRFLVDRFEKIYKGNSVFYIWAVIKDMEGQDVYN